MIQKTKLKKIRNSRGYSRSKTKFKAAIKYGTYCLEDQSQNYDEDVERKIIKQSR